MIYENEKRFFTKDCSEKIDNKPVFTNAGECLEYALEKELMEEHELFFVPVNLTAFVVYYTLIGEMNPDTPKILMCYVRECHYGTADFESVYQKIAGIIVSGLSERYKFNDSEEMYRAVSNVTIPLWVFNTARELAGMFPEIYLFDDCLYYIRRFRDDHALVCVSTRVIKSALDSDNSGDYDDDDDDDHDINGDKMYTISSSYSQILGCDRERKILFLKYKNTDELFAAYYVENDETIVYHYWYIGMFCQNVPVVEENGFVSLLIDGIPKAIKKADPFEEYTAYEDYILVEPRRYVPAFFTPYYLLYDGTVKESSYWETAQYILDRILKECCDTPGISAQFTGVILKVGTDTLNCQASVFTPSRFTEILDKKINGENPVIERYSVLGSYLKKLLPEGQDILEYLCLFAECSSRMLLSSQYQIVSERLLEILNEMMVSGRLKQKMGNLSELRATLLAQARWDDTSVLKEKELLSVTRERTNCILVGRFSYDLIEGKVMAFPEHVSEAQVSGSLILPGKTDDCGDILHSGMVSFNLDTGIYEICSHGRLIASQKRAVIDSFSLATKQYRFYVDDV